MRANLGCFALFLAASLVADLAAAQSLGGTASDALPSAALENAPASFPDDRSNSTAERSAITPGLPPASHATRTNAETFGNGAESIAARPQADDPAPTPEAAAARPASGEDAAATTRNDLPPPASKQGNDAWRYRWHDNLWWYWTPQKTWQILQGGRWVPYQAGAMYARENARPLASGNAVYSQRGQTYSSDDDGYSVDRSSTTVYAPSGGYISTYSTGPRRWSTGYRGYGNVYNGYGGGYRSGYYDPGYGRGYGSYGSYGSYGGYGGYGRGMGGYYGSPGAVLGGSIGSSIGGYRGGAFGAGMGVGIGGRGW